MAVILKAKNLTKKYVNNNLTITAVDNLSFSINKGKIVVILGPSGAGKSTLLNLIGGMDTISEGSLIVDGEDISSFNKQQLSKYRRDKIGFVFQFYNLMPNLTAKENVELASELKEDSFDAEQILIQVGLQERMNNFPSQLSGGEQQRVSIARAIAKNPSILLCDEPTGALDYQTGKQILSLLASYSKKDKKTVIIVTHNSALKDMANQLIRIKNGKIIENSINKNPKPIEEIEW
jgi:putative ABC transport system ATP-binding protein